MNRHENGFWLVAAAFLVGMSFSTVPAPLYPLYQARDGFGSFTVTVIFAVYAVGVVASLFLAGHVSDWLGRRRMLVAALLAEALAALVFLAWESVPALLVARVLTGLGVGVLTATSTAALLELHTAARPAATRRRADLVSAGVNMGGLGLGTFVAGLLAEWVPHPLHVPYVVVLVALLLAAGGILVVPETVPESVLAERRPYRTQGVSVPRESFAAYAGACAAAFAGFAVMALFTSLAPIIVAKELDHPSRALAGALGLLVFGAGAIAQAVLGRLAPARQVRIGTIGVGIGLPVFVVAVYAGSLPLLLVASAGTGMGVGTLVRGGITTAASLARPETRGETMAGFFLVGYLGLIIPVVALGIATQYVEIKPALLGFAVGIVAVLVGLTLLGRPRSRTSAAAATP